MNWDVAASAEVKALVLARQQMIPGAGGPPLCPCCGLPIRDPDFHHRKKQRKGGWAGDGRPSNLLAVHGRLEAAQCHHTAIHEDVAAARDQGWIIRTSAPLAAYGLPLWDAHRGWITLDDEGGWQPEVR